MKKVGWIVAIVLLIAGCEERTSERLQTRAKVYYLDDIFYFTDPETELCFAAIYGNSEYGFTNVPCSDKVIAQIVNPPEKAVVPVTTPVTDGAGGGLAGQNKVAQTSATTSGLIQVNVQTLDNAQISVWLVRGSERILLPAAVAVGTYNVQAHFVGWDAPTTLFYNLTVGPRSNTLTFVCSNKFASCEPHISP